jgi:hypothetical protein
MSDLRRCGFIRASDGISKAANVWHGETFSRLEGNVALNGHGPLTAANSTIFAEYAKLVSITAEQLRVWLRDGELRAFLFNHHFGGITSPIAICETRRRKRRFHWGGLSKNSAASLSNRYSRYDHVILIPTELAYFFSCCRPRILQS